MNARTASILRAAKAEPDKSADTAFERHFTAEALAELWGYHPSTVRKMFQGEPGVIRTTNSVRVPESVAKRKYAELVG